MTSKIKDIECLCVFVTALGPFVEPFKALLDATEVMLVSFKVILSLIPTNIEDLLEKERLKLALLGIETALKPVEIPFKTLNNFTSAFADCPPVAGVADWSNIIKTFLGISKVEELRFEIDQKIDAIERESLKIQQLDELITVIQDLKGALDECGNA